MWTNGQTDGRTGRWTDSEMEGQIDRKRDRHDEANSRFSQIYESA